MKYERAFGGEAKSVDTMLYDLLGQQSRSEESSLLGPPAAAAAKGDFCRITKQPPETFRGNNFPPKKKNNATSEALAF